MNDPLTDEVRAALAAGRKIHAIKLLRDARGLSLRQAKQIVDRAGSPAVVKPNKPGSGLSPGEVPRTSMPARIVVFLAAAVGAAAWYVFSGS